MVNKTGLDLGGVDLRTLGYEVASVEGWDGWPGMRIGEAHHAYEHGTRFDDRGFFNPRDLGISMVVLPRDPITGLQTLDPAEHAQANVDDLLGALYNLNGVTLIRTMPDATVRELFDLRSVSVWPVETGPGSFGRRFNILLHAAYPFWQQTGIQSQAGQTGGFSAVNDGNAPINNMVVTFNTAGRLTHNVSGDYIETDTTASIVVDVGAKTVAIGSTFHDNEFHRNRAWWLQMEAGSNAFTVTLGGNVDITWFHHWL